MLDPPNKQLHLWLLFVAFFISAVSGAKVRTREEGFNFAADYDDVVGEIKHENFTCEGKKYGYYADQALDCKVFHICSPVESGTGRHVKTFMFSFFCPDTTIFSQDSRTCITERYALPCHRAHTLYSLNSAIGVITPKGSRKHLPGVSFSSNSNINNVIPGGSGVTQKPQVFPQSSHRFSGLEPSKVISQSSKDRSLLNESLGKDSKDTTFDFKVRLGSNSSENFVERGIEKQNEEVNGKEVNKQANVKNNASGLNVNLKNQNTITGRNKNVPEPITTPRPTPKIVNSNHQQSQIPPRPKEGKPNPSFNVRTSLGENQNIADLPNPGISSLLSKNIPSHAKVSLSSNQNIGGNKKESSSFAVHNKPSTKNQLEARALGKISSQKNIQDQESITTTFASVDNVAQEYQLEVNNTENEFDYPELLDLYDDLLQFEPDPRDLKPKVKNNQKGINSNKFGNNKDDNKNSQGLNKHTTNVGPPEKILPPPMVLIDAEFKQDIENDQVEDIDFDDDSDSIEEGEGPLENTDSSFVLSANVPTSRSVNSLQSSIYSPDNEDRIHRVRGNTNNRSRNNQISRTTEEATAGQKRPHASKTTTISPVTLARTVGLATRNNVKTTTTPKTTTTTFAPVPRNYTTTTLRPITSERGSKRFVPSSLLRQNSNFGPHLSVTQNREKENHKTNGVSQIARPVSTTQTSPHIEELSSSQGPTRGTASPRPRVVTTTAPRSRVVTTAPQLLVTQSPSNIKIAQKPIIPLLIKKTDQLTQNHKEKEHQNASISKHIEKEFTKEVLDNQTSDNLLSTLPKAGEPIEEINHSIQTTEVKNLERSSSKDTSISEKIQEKSAVFKEISKEKAKEIKEGTKERINGQNGAIRKVTRTKVSPISRQVAEKNGPVIETNNLQGDKFSTNSTVIDDNEQHNKPVLNLATISPNNVVLLSSEKQTRSKAIAVDSSSFRNNSARITKETDLNYDEQNLNTYQNYTIQNVVAINSDSFRKKDLRVPHQTSEDFQKTELVEKASANENANVPNKLPNAEVSVPVSRRRTTSRSLGTAKFQAVNQDISSKEGIKTNVLPIRPQQTIVKKSKDKINLEISSNIAPIEIIKPKGLEIKKGTENLHDQSKSGNVEQLTGTLNNTNPNQVKSEQANNDSSKPNGKVNLTEPTIRRRIVVSPKAPQLLQSTGTLSNTEKTTNKSSVHDEKVNTNESINLSSQTPVRRRIVSSPKSTQLPQLTSQLNSKNQQVNAENTKIESYELNEKVNSNEPINLSNPTPIRTRIVASPNPIVSNTRSRGRSRSSSSTTKTVSNPNTPQPTNSNSSLITPKKAPTDIRKGKNINAKSGSINLLPPIPGKINSAQLAEIEKQIQRFASGNGAQLIAYSVKKNEKQPQKSAPANSKIEKILEESKLTLTPEVLKKQAANISEADSSSGNEHQTRNITSNSGTKSTTVLQNASEPQVRRRLTSRVKVQALNFQSSENNTVKDTGKNVDPVASSISIINKVNKPTNSLETKLNVTLEDDHKKVNKIQLKKQKSIGETAVTEQSLLSDNQINTNTENIIDVQKNGHPEVVKSISDNSETSLNQPRRNTRVRKISQINTTQGTTPVTFTTLSVTEAKQSPSTTTPKTISRQRTRGRSVGRRIEDPVATSKVRVIEEKKLENQLVSPNDIVLSNQSDKQENSTTITVETVTFENRASNIQRTRNRASFAQRNKANTAQTTVTINAPINQASVSTTPISEEVKKGNEVGARSPVSLSKSIRNLNTNRQRNRGGPNVDLYDNNHINETKFEEQKVANLIEEKINLITSTPPSKVSLTEIIKPKSLLSSLRTQNKLQGRSRNRDLGIINHIKVPESTQNNSAVLSANDPINIIINSHSKNLTEEAKKVEKVDETTTLKSIDTKINSRTRIRNSKSETIVNKKSQIVNEDLLDSKEHANLKSKPSRRVVNTEQSSTSTIAPTQPPNQKVKDLELSEQNTVQSAVRRITRKRITTAEQTDTKPQVVKSVSSLETKDDKESFKEVPNKVIENHNGEKTTGNSSVRRVSRKRVSSHDKSNNPVTEITTTNVNKTQRDDMISKVFESFAATTTEKVQTSFQKKTVSRGSRKFEEDTPKEDLHFALDLLSEVDTDLKSGKDAKQYSVSLTEREPTSKKVLKKVIPAREFRQKGSEGAEENAEVFSGLKLRVVGTSVKSSVSSVSNGKEGKKNLDLATSSTSTNSQSLTDLELEALRSLTQVNEPVRNRNQESSQNSRRKLISRRKV